MIINVSKDDFRQCFAIFKTAFSSSLKEAKKQEIDLTEESPSAFEAFADWRYSGNVQHSLDYDRITPTATFWLRAYAMADRQMTKGFRSLALCQILVSEDAPPTEDFIAELFGYGLDKKQLEKYFVRRYAFTCKKANSERMHLHVARCGPLERMRLRLRHQRKHGEE